MASPITPEIPGAPDEGPGNPPRSRVAFAATALAVTALCAGWIYVFFIYDPGLLIDELGDRTFPTAAEEICAVSRSELDELPPAVFATTADQRADDVERSNTVLSSMIAELRAIAPKPPAAAEQLTVDELSLDDQQQLAAAEGIEEWLGDWSTYISDRKDYVENLRVDDEARFLESTKGSDTRGITRAINSFAQVNRMASCETPADVS